MMLERENGNKKMARQANYRRMYFAQFWCYDDTSKTKSKANWMNYTTIVKESIESLWALTYDVEGNESFQQNVASTKPAWS